MKLITCLILTTLTVFAVMAVRKNFLRKQEHEINGTPSKMVTDIINECTSEMAKKYGVFPVGLGLGGEISSAGLLIEVHQELNQNALRNIALDCWTLLNDKINASEELKPFLTPYPFSASLDLFIMNKDGSRNFDPTICFVGVGKDGVCYHTNEPDKEFGYKNTFEESIEDAIDKNKRYLSQRAELEESGL